MRRVFVVFALLVLFSTVLVIHSAEAAILSSPDIPQTPFDQETGVLLLVGLPSVTDLPVDLPTEAFIEDRLNTQLMDAVNRLIYLREQGFVTDFRLHPEIGGILIQGSSPGVVAELTSWHGVQSVVPASAANRSLARERMTNLRQQVRAFSLQARSVSKGSPDVGEVGQMRVGEAGWKFQATVNENRFESFQGTANTSITIRLKDSGGTLKAESSTTTDSSGRFVIQLGSIIRGGDRIEVLPQGEGKLEVVVANLTAVANKVNDVLTGDAPGGGRLFVFAWGPYDSVNGWKSFSDTITVPGDGHYSYNFAPHLDMRGGQSGWVTLSGDVFDVRLNYTIAGFWLNPASNSAGGSGLPPGEKLRVQILDGAGNLLAEKEGEVSSYGDVWLGQFAGCGLALVDFQPGYQGRFQLGQLPPVVIQIPVFSMATNKDNDTLTGSAPAAAKLSGFVSKRLGGSYTQIAQFSSDANGKFDVNFNGQLDIEAGDYGSVTYYDVADNQINLYAYAPGLISANLTWDSLNLTGETNESAWIVLRNSLGAIKSQGNAHLDKGGYGYHYFVDGDGNSIDLVAGDQVEVFGAGLKETFVVEQITAIADRTNRAVFGRGPKPNAELLISINYGNPSKTVQTDGNGNYRAEFTSSMTGGYGVDVAYRPVAGRETVVRIYAPQFTARPQTGYISFYGYAAPNQAVSIEVHNNSRVLKARGSATTNQYGGYWISTIEGNVSLEPGDRVTMQSGPISTTFTAISLTVEGNAQTNLVAGKTIPNGWLNVYANRYFDGHSWYYYRYFYADSQGNYATDFGGVDLWPGDQVYAAYWEGQNDRQEARSYIGPHLRVDRIFNTISGAAAPGQQGTLTIRNSGGQVRTSVNIATSSDGYFWSGSFMDGAGNPIQLLDGDRVTLTVGDITTETVLPPLTAAIDLQNERVNGVGPANRPVYVSAYHWRGSWYSTWSGSGYLADVVQSNADGGYSADFHCVADLTRGDYAAVTYLDSQYHYHRTSGFSTSPNVTIASVPVSVRAADIVRVEWEIGNAAHVEYTYAIYSSTPTTWGGSTAVLRGNSGKFQTEFAAPNGGSFYVRVYARVDGQSFTTPAKQVTITENLPLTMIDPVNGTTNQKRPIVRGVATPGNTVNLYDGATLIGSTTASSNGVFGLQPQQDLSNGVHALSVADTSAVGAAAQTNPVQVTVNSGLPVDPMHIYITTRGQRQRLRDENGYASLGGRVWTRAGDNASVEIPIECTDVRQADLLVGGVYATSLINRGVSVGSSSVWFGSYSPPSSGSYALALLLNCAGATSTITLLNGLIDPDGYVYDATAGLDHRIDNATVTCYQQDGALWRSWPAALYDQINPQTTGSDGYYAFFTEPGTYKVIVEAEGYYRHESPPLSVVDKPVHYDAALVPWMKIHLPMVER